MTQTLLQGFGADNPVPGQTVPPPVTPAAIGRVRGYPREILPAEPSERDVGSVRRNEGRGVNTHAVPGAGSSWPSRICPRPLPVDSGLPSDPEAGSAGLQVWQRRRKRERCGLSSAPAVREHRRWRWIGRIIPCVRAGRDPSVAWRGRYLAQIPMIACR